MWRFLDCRKVKKNKKNIGTSLIDVKFDENFKPELRIGLPCKENPENCKKPVGKKEKFRKIAENSFVTLNKVSASLEKILVALQ